MEEQEEQIEEAVGNSLQETPNAPRTTRPYFYESTVLIRYDGKYVYLLRCGDVGESPFVVEAVGEKRDDFLHTLLQNRTRMQERRTLANSYDPDVLGTMAQELVTHVRRGEILAQNRPPASPPVPGLVY